MKKSDSDGSNGYEAVANEFAAARGRSNIGAEIVRRWAQELEPGSDILDLGCGNGTPISQMLTDSGFSVYGIDASPTMVSEFSKNFPKARVACETVETSAFFGRTFDAAVACGLFFLLRENAQRELIFRVSNALRSGGIFLFTSPSKAVSWTDVLTGHRSISLGAESYKSILAEAGFSLIAEYDDEGGNHYYGAIDLKGFSNCISFD